MLLVFLFILALSRTTPSHFEDAFLRFFLLMIFFTIYFPKVDELLLHVIQLFGNIGQLYPRKGNFIHVEILSDLRIVMTKNFTFGFGVVQASNFLVNFTVYHFSVVKMKLIFLSQYFKYFSTWHVNHGAKAVVAGADLTVLILLDVKNVKVLVMLLLLGRLILVVEEAGGVDLMIELIEEQRGKVSVWIIVLDVNRI